MKNKAKNLKISIFLLSTFYFLLSTFFVDAQTAPQFLITWRSQSYAPSWYQGKVLATRGSWADVSFDLINNGKIVDLSKNKVRWYVNDDLKRNEDDGLGIKNFYFGVDNYSRDDINIRIVVVDYLDEQIARIITIPLINSEVVIDAPYSGRRLSSGTNMFKAYPYFFNIDDLSKLSFDWTVNGRPAEGASGSADNLKLNIDNLAPSGFGIDVRATIKNLADEMEFASSQIKLDVK
mgnify:CR=1 FL=1